MALATRPVNRAIPAVPVDRDEQPLCADSGHSLSSKHSVGFDSKRSSSCRLPARDGYMDNLRLPGA
jgi:hypothetical protein